MIKIMHRAAQYLAAAGISFLEKEQDDSHTSFVWDSSLKAMIGQTLNREKGIRLALDYDDYALCFLDNFKNVISVKGLNGSKHRDILFWIQKEAENNGLHGPYNYQFHYELPYSKMATSFSFPEPDMDQISAMINHRTLAQKSLETVIKKLGMQIPVRVWPHHFDTGTLISTGTGDKEGFIKSIGIGLAIPDTMVNDYYFYVSGWSQSGSVKVERMSSLSKGEWRSGNWNGSVLEASGKDAQEVILFLAESIKMYHEII